jgi:nucleotide-binding universal stress UspA family protein
VSEEEHLAWSAVRRILVPVNGQEYAMAAGDVAAHLAHACDAELVALHVARPEMDPLFWRERDHRVLRRYARGIVREMAFRVGRLDVRITERVEVDDDPGMAIARELSQGDYPLVVMGALERGVESHPYLGHTIRTVLTHSRTPALLLIARGGRGEL